MIRPLRPVSGGITGSTSTVRRERRAHEEGGKPVPGADADDATPSAEGLRALDWLTLLLAALLTGFGPFVSLHLAGQGWMPANVGLILTVSGLAGLLTQIPAGELIDMVKSKRVLVGTGAVAVTLGILTL